MTEETFDSIIPWTVVYIFVILVIVIQANHNADKIRTIIKKMIYVGTKIEIRDNSGAKKARCIKILNKKPLGFGCIGSIAVVSLLKTTSPSKLHRTSKIQVKKGDVCLALITETKKGVQRKDGSSLRFCNSNAGVLVSQKYEPIGTRMTGLLSFEQRKNTKIKSSSFLSLTKYKLL